MDLTRAAIEKNRVTAAMLGVVLIGGLLAFNSLPRAEDPGFVIRTAQVITQFPGASPERVEDLVTHHLERAIREIPELESVESTSKTGVSIITVNIQEKYKEMRPIWDSLRRKVEREAPNLPKGAHDPIVNDEFGDVFGIVMSLTGDGFSYAELKEVADSTRDGFLRLPDVAKVEILGVQDERIFIEYENARLAELGLAPAELSDILEAQNIVTPGGSIRLGPERIVIEPSGSFESLEDVRRAILQLGDSEEVLYLEDIVEIHRDYIDPPVERVHTGRGAVLFHSEEPSFPVEDPKTAALVLAVSMREGGRLTELGRQVEELMRIFNEAYPIGLQLDPVVFQPHDVQEVIDSFVSNLVQAVDRRHGGDAGLPRAADGPRDLGADPDGDDDDPARHAAHRDRPRPDLAGGADHRAGHARRQRRRDGGVDRRRHDLGALGQGSGDPCGEGAARSPADGLAHHVRCLPPDLSGRVGDRRVHRIALHGRDDRAARLLAAGAHDDPDALRGLPARRAESRRRASFDSPVYRIYRRILGRTASPQGTHPRGRGPRFRRHGLGGALRARPLLSAFGSAEPRGRDRAAPRHGHRVHAKSSCRDSRAISSTTSS